MSISDRVEEALIKNNFNVLNTENTIKCIEFTKKMKSAGVLRSNLEPNTNILDGGINQLKLYAISSIIGYYDK